MACICKNIHIQTWGVVIDVRARVERWMWRLAISAGNAGIYVLPLPIDCKYTTFTITSSAYLQQMNRHRRLGSLGCKIHQWTSELNKNTMLISTTIHPSTHLPLVDVIAILKVQRFFALHGGVKLQFITRANVDKATGNNKKEHFGHRVLLNI